MRARARRILEYFSLFSHRVRISWLVGQLAKCRTRILFTDITSWNIVIIPLLLYTIYTMQSRAHTQITKKKKTILHFLFIVYKFGVLYEFAIICICTTWYVQSIDAALMIFNVRRVVQNHDHHIQTVMLFILYTQTYFHPSNQPSTCEK